MANLDRAEYDSTVSETVFESLRELARNTAMRLNNSGSTVQTLKEERQDVTVAKPRRFFPGQSTTTESQMVPVVQGWDLALKWKPAIMGDDGREWFQWTSGFVLTVGGELKAITRKREELRTGIGVNVSFDVSLEEVTSLSIRQSDQQWEDGPFTGPYGSQLEDALRKLT